ncbi:hypothetical protein KIPB_007738, partial [Kipferlia bialata]
LMRVEAGLPGEGFVFCCLNQVYKIDPSTFHAFMTILEKVDNSHLVLLKYPPQSMKHIQSYVATHYPALRERIRFLDVVEQKQHIMRSRLMGLFLDTPSCNGHSTVAESLFAGLPVVTYPGNKMPSRVAASMLHAVGLDELVAKDYREYVSLAVRMATDQTYYTDVRSRLIASRHSAPLWDRHQWCAHMDRALMCAARHWTLGGSPMTFTVSDCDVDSGTILRREVELHQAPDPPGWTGDRDHHQRPKMAEGERERERTADTAVSPSSLTDVVPPEAKRGPSE